MLYLRITIVCQNKSVKGDVMQCTLQALLFSVKFTFQHRLHVKQKQYVVKIIIKTNVSRSQESNIQLGLSCQKYLIFSNFCHSRKRKKREKSLETVIHFKTQKALNTTYSPYLLAILTETLDLTIHKKFIEVVLYG